MNKKCGLLEPGLVSALVIPDTWTPFKWNAACNSRIEIIKLIFKRIQKALKFMHLLAWIIQIKMLHIQGMLHMHILTMARKNGEFGNVIPRKFCHLEGNFNLLDIKEIQKNSGKFDHMPRKFAFFRAVILTKADSDWLPNYIPSL